jgi:cation diffusion facilitator CzcD-associated flavoprotein CzcO
LRDFQGQLVHSAAWDHSYDYSHKRIAVIGNGSSAIQIIPALADLQGTDITCFQRGPTWILARHTPAKLLGQEGTLANLAYSEADKRRFRLNPREHNKYRKQLVHRINRNFGIVNHPLLD